MNIATTLKKSLPVGAAITAALAASTAQATTFTTTSPTSGGALSSSFSEIGGIVLDLIGSNNARVTSQLAASSLFEGFANSNPLTIGTQSGFNTSVVNALGGGLKEAAVRITLSDGDTAAGNFDFNANTLLVNNLNFGNFSNVNAQETDSAGTTGFSLSGGGFRNDTLDTGWFYVTEAGILSDFYNSLVSLGQVSYELDDAVNPGDNFYDFTLGIDSSQINVGQPPVVQPPSQSVPEPVSVLGLLAVGALSTASLKRKQEQEV